MLFGERTRTRVVQKSRALTRIVPFSTYFDDFRKKCSSTREIEITGRRCRLVLEVKDISPRDSLALYYWSPRRTDGRTDGQRLTRGQHSGGDDGTGFPNNDDAAVASPQILLPIPTHHLAGTFFWERRKNRISFSRAFLCVYLRVDHNGQQKGQQAIHFPETIYYDDHHDSFMISENRTGQDRTGQEIHTALICPSVLLLH